MIFERCRDSSGKIYDDITRGRVLSIKVYRLECCFQGKYSHTVGSTMLIGGEKGLKIESP